jgi:hypothetical protein
MQQDDGTRNDPIEDWERANETVTNDAVAGETVLPGAGDGNDGPTGGSPKEGEPILDEHDALVEDADRVATSESGPVSDAESTGVTDEAGFAADEDEELDISEHDGPEL